MSTIFISHSSKDNVFAGKVNGFLNQIGHRSVFLDFDPHVGIPAGRSWEKELYTNLRKCEVCIILCSAEFTSSEWCFAEITHAKALGKYIIPIKISECTVNSILLDVQVIDATTDVETAFKRLEHGLTAAGVNKHVWENNRPPYPGLLAFREEDAPVFFGREEETANLYKSLRRYRSFGGPKLLMVLGASGSGKTSLIKAGLIPQLRKDERSWIVVGPFRPLKQPFEELSKSLSKAFNYFNDKRTWQEIYNLLSTQSKKDGSINEALANVFKELKEISQQPDPTILIFIDQFEELLSTNNKKDQQEINNIEDIFISCLRSFLDTDNSKFLIIGTLRSDFLGNFQENQSFKGLAFDDHIVRSVTPEGLRASIEEPARVAGVELEEGLADAIIRDTGTADALPLLAFTLRELWEQHGNNNLLGIDEYKNKLGGLEGSVARVAEAVLMAHIAETKRGEIIKEHNENKARLDLQDEKLLKVAFMAMVRIDEEGRFTRRYTKWEELPVHISDLLQRFITARLLTTYNEGKDIKIEVAHEALFRTWSRLVNWLQEDKNFLLWRKRLSTAQDEWERSRRNESQLLRGTSLGEAVAWLQKHTSGKYNLNHKEVAFIRTSFDVSEKQRLRKVRNLRLLLAAALAVAIIIAGFGYWIYKNNIETKNQLARTYWDKSQIARAQNNSLNALHYTAEALSLTNDENVTQNLLLDIQPFLPQTILINILTNKHFISNAVYSPGGKLILTASNDGTASIWDAETGKQIDSLKLGSNIIGAVYSPDGKQVLTTSLDKTIRLWSAGSGKLLGSFAHDGNVVSAVFSADGQKILTASWDKSVRLWDAATGNQINLMQHSDAVNSAVFSPNEKQVLTASDDKTARIWDALTGKQVTVMKHESLVLNAVFSADGKQVVTASGDGSARVWDAATGKQIAIMQHTDALIKASFSSDAKKVLTVCRDSTVRLWLAETGVQVAVMRHNDALNSATFSPDGKQILTASDDKTARLWDAETGKQMALMLHDDAVNSAIFKIDGKGILTVSGGTARLWQTAITPENKVRQQESVVKGALFSKDGKRILFISDDYTARLSDVATGKQISFMKLGGYIESAVFSPDEKFILTSSLDSTARLWNAETGEQILVMQHADIIRSAVFSKDGKQILTASDDKTACLWNAATGKRTGVILKHNAVVTSAVFSPEDKNILTASFDGTARLWNAKTGKQLFSMQHSNNVRSAVFSPDGNSILTVNGEMAHVWDAGTGKQKALIQHGSIVNTAVFSPDGKLVLTASYDKTVRLSEAANGRQTGPAMKHEAIVNCAFFSPNGKRLLTVTDETARLWESGTGRLIGSEIQYNTAGNLNIPVFSPDGKEILTLDYDEGNTSLFKVSTADLDLPADLFKLQASATTGVALGIETGEIQLIPFDQKHYLYQDYYNRARDHYLVCRYPEQNLWRRFYPEEAKKIH